MKLSVFCDRSGHVSFSSDGDINLVKDDLQPNNEMNAGITMNLQKGDIVSYRGVELFSIGHTDGYGCFIEPIQSPVERNYTKSVFEL
jgi:hypothetical protein